ncbi:sulfotransferase [Sphingomonas sp. LY54]|uniref:sulfotransferase n=1 Tax=Sphingomonas sp. LY54 TaxID=3095343 RepID=UPI002D783FEB|nr:sulfotransferase [Sphingomonas sp. LY54]WRP28208.1 sulfotransferase [Sphingomonas sp. LY54]
MLLIGAPKSGTTWLSRCLGEHPDLFMPREEIHYYSRHHHKGEAWYARHFRGCAPGQRLAENSNSYLTDPRALERIAPDQPEARILCILRNPVDRAYSSYGMQVDRGRASSDIDLYLDPGRSPRPHILTNGLYARQLAAWYVAYPRSRILVVRHDDIAERPTLLYKRVLDFLSLDCNFMPTGLGVRENARKAEGVPGPVKRMLWWARPALETAPLRAFRSGPVGKWVTKSLSRPKYYPPLTPELRRRLEAFYRPEIEALSELVQEDFTCWLAGEENSTGRPGDAKPLARPDLEIRPPQRAE